MFSMRISAIGLLLITSFAAFAEEESNPKLSYSFFGIGQERPTYKESLDNFGGQKFESEFQSTGVMQTSGGYTQVTPQWGFEIITSSTLLAEETTEDWEFSNFGVVQLDNTTLSQNSLVINGVHLPFNDGQKILFGIRYQKIAFSRFNFQGTENVAALNTALLANDTEYDRLVTLITDFIGGGGEVSQGIPDPTDSNKILVDENNKLITSVDELTAARAFDPETQEGVIFEDATSISAMVGYGFDSYFENPDIGFRWRGGVQLGIPLYISVLNTKNNITLTETMPAGYDVNAYIGAGYQFSKEIGVIAQYNLLVSQRDKIQEGDVSLPDNEYQAASVSADIYWAF